MWRNPSNTTIPPSGTSLCGHLRERHQLGPRSSARWEFQGVMPWLLWWNPSGTMCCPHRQEPKGPPKQLGQRVDLFTLWCQASRRAVGMRGWTFPHLELCFQCSGYSRELQDRAVKGFVNRLLGS